MRASLLNRIGGTEPILTIPIIGVSTFKHINADIDNASLPELASGSPRTRLRLVTDLRDTLPPPVESGTLEHEPLPRR